MEKQLMLIGVVRSVCDKSKDGKLFMRQYKIEVECAKDDVNNLIFCDHDLERRFEVGKMIPEIKVRPAISEFNGLHIEFHNLYKGDGNVLGKEDKGKKPDIKI